MHHLIGIHYVSALVCEIHTVGNCSTAQFVEWGPFDRVVKRIYETAS